jgi:hypothetical protein
VSKAVPVWVNGVCYAGVAAAAVSRLSGENVSATGLSRLLRRRGAFPFGRIRISATAPEPEEPAGAAAVPRGRTALLIYPRGESPLDRGVCRGGA